MSTNKVKEYKGSFGEAFRVIEKADNKPYILRKTNNDCVNITNSYGFNTSSYSRETIGSGEFNSGQLKTF